MIRDAYDRAANIIAARGHVPEDFAVALQVENLRLTWRPSSVRVVMLAESHVWTSEAETESRVQQPDGTETAFARFVYCLGYGERSLVAPTVLPNAGTSQYWRLFHDAVHGPETSRAEIQSRNPTTRAFAKLQLLKALKLAGIWLVDASVIALYPNKGLSRNDYKNILRACWDAHVREVVAGCSASAIMIVGKGVNEAIGDLVKQAAPQAEVAVVNQPNARLSSNEIWEDRLKVFDLCRRHLSN